jgi:hypothetical protein
MVNTVEEETLQVLKRIEELLIGFAQTQERIARSLSILANSAQHGRSR